MTLPFCCMVQKPWIRYNFLIHRFTKGWCQCVQNIQKVRFLFKNHKKWQKTYMGDLSPLKSGKYLTSTGSSLTDFQMFLVESSLNCGISSTNLTCSRLSRNFRPARTSFAKKAVNTNFLQPRPFSF